MVQAGFEVLVISFSALLGRSSADFLGYPHPVVRSVAVNEGDEPVVLALRPRAAAVGNHLVEGYHWRRWQIESVRS